MELTAGRAMNTLCLLGAQLLLSSMTLNERKGQIFGRVLAVSIEAQKWLSYSEILNDNENEYQLKRKTKVWNLMASIMASINKTSRFSSQVAPQPETPVSVSKALQLLDCRVFSMCLSRLWASPPLFPLLGWLLDIWRCCQQLKISAWALQDLGPSLQTLFV